MSESGPERPIRPSLEKIDLENSDEEKKARRNSLKHRAINASAKFRTSFAKKSRRNSKVMSVVVEDEHDAEDLKAVEALRQALIPEDLQPAKHDDFHTLLRLLMLLQNYFFSILTTYQLNGDIFIIGGHFDLYSYECIHSDYMLTQTA
ncbi:CRAL-TRIO domain-containing protein [Artemisia annua]|uniref:CRAL-TRIO domain-containing protein n=1 Tax=Artemisia annua TaxID=35608 RepID=A0A2U1KQ95_ARTAN|nr:CRAL-TRIO domain-containing protein [Artemisia annua]